MSQFDDALNNIKSMKSENGDSFMDKAKQTIKGSAMGAVVGLMYGWYNQKNVYVYGVLGAVAGGLINYMVIGYKKEK